MVLLEPNNHTKTKSKSRPRTTDAATSSPATVAKKVSEAIRDLVSLMIQKSVYGWSTWRSGKKMISTAAVAERGKIIGRSFNDLVLRHNTALGCTSHDVRLSFVSPRDYEFSCTSSPPPRLRRNHRHSTSSSSSSHHHYNRHVSKRRTRGGFVNMDHYGSYKPNRVVLRPVEDWNEVDDVAKAKSSNINSYYGGGGDGAGDEFHVDKAAEEFIARFYRELLMQKWTAAREGSERFV